MTVGPFDVCGPLPRGVTVLEASAGTGKTFAIAALAARYVADGVPLERMLLVTFTRMATGELRERVRERLVSVERGLAAAQGGEPTDPADTVLTLLASGTPEEVTARRRRLASAVTNFDAATIITTHGFCQQMLASLGIAGNADSDATLVEDLSDLVEETVDDLVTARVLRGARSPMTRDVALTVARFALNNPSTPLFRPTTGKDSPEVIRRALANRAREVVDARKRRARLLTYDDLLTRLADAVDPEKNPVSAPAAVARLRRRFQVVLVDEFQDTDELQWDILSRAFSDAGPDGRRALVLIGDPKQAIYSFRGADVHAYLSATREAAEVDTLDVNWRSDQDLIDAFDLVFGDARLGHADIVYRPVRAAPHHARPGIEGAPGDAPLRIRVLHRGDGQVQLTPRGWASVGSARLLIARDLAADVVRLLAARPELVDRDPAGAERGRRPLHPGNVAVLTSRHRDSMTVREALADAGVPAVINGAGSVFDTPAARDWLLLLEALIRPTSSARIRTVALTPWVGWTAQEIDDASEADWEALHAACHQWAAVLGSAGVAALAELVTRSRDMPGRLLAEPDGERQLTDLRHIGQLLHAEATEQALGATALAAWLRRRMADAGTDGGAEERSRRLESDADAVQILTIHRSKGLEYPVVYAPFLWDAKYIRDGEPAVFHDRREAGEPRTLDVSGGEGRDFITHRQWDLEEQRGEELRLAYVALTRAKHRVVVWWAASQKSRASALGRLFFGRDPDGTMPPGGRNVPSDDEAARRLEAKGAGAPGRLAVEQVKPTDERWDTVPVAPPDLAAAGWSRDLDASWRRTSYSGLTAAAHEATVASEPESGGLSDEPVLGEEGGAPEETVEGPESLALREGSLPLATMPAGARPGTLVHAVLEVVDFTTPDVRSSLAQAIAEQSARFPVGLGDSDVAGGLEAALRTPLGPLAGDRCLADIGRGDRLDELGFELPVGGGEHPDGLVSLGDVADLLAEHVSPGDPLSPYPQRLRDPAIAEAWRGYLTGSLDLVARIPGDRYILMDYKTNLLAPADTVTSWDYRPEALDVAMQRAHYPLQALIYSAALHRYLRWRLPAYDPPRHLGGVLYLFLRGMSGPDTPRVGDQPCGVWAWRPPDALVVGLSDLLDRGSRSRS